MTDVFHILFSYLVDIIFVMSFNSPILADFSRKSSFFRFSKKFLCGVAVDPQLPTYHLRSF